MVFSINKDIVHEIEIKKSKFITYLFHIQSTEDAEHYISEVAKEHKKATHVCYAYRLSQPTREKASDNGEPSGTAGVPMLDVLKKRDVQNVLAIVVRYFGGIKLGAGGLVRAYAGSVSETLDMVKLIKWKTLPEYQIIVSFDEYKNIVYKLESIAEKIDVQYKDQVFITFLSETEQKSLESLLQVPVVYQGIKDTICE